MDCYVGSSTGALKGISLKDNTFQNLTSIKSLDPKKDEITAMCWFSEYQTEVMTVQLDRQLKLFDTERNSQIDVITVEGGEGPVKGIHMIGSRDIVTCVESGETKIWTGKGKELASWNVGKGITIMRGSSDEKNQVATGGTKNLIKTWDLETGKEVWSAKNVHLDKLQLEVPIMVTDLLFVDDGNQIVEATKLHEMRLYDPRAQRRPVKQIPFMENPITSVSTCYRPNHLLAANSIGEMGLFDLRSKVHPVCKYKGQAGSIRCIDAHPTAPYVASCGIDRFVRVHDIETRKLVHKIYCKTRLNKILMREGLSILKKNIKEEEDWEELKNSGESDEDSSDDDDSSDEDTSLDDSGDDAVWEEIDTNKKRRKRKEDEEEAVPEPTKKRKTIPPRKRKDSAHLDEIVEKPLKKSKREEDDEDADSSADEVEIKEEVFSDEEPVPVKKRRVSAPKKKKSKV